MDKITNTLIVDEFEESFLNYAMSVNTDRAIPSIEDGFKPIHRRIIWDMINKKNLSSKPTVKCAKVVGSVIGSWHPHGDSSTYGALVGLAQDWNMRYPLIFIQGNAGSRDGDSAAHMRYTECRLTPLAEVTARDLNKDIVDFQPNFDESLQEPVYLNGIFPHLLCNGTTGIGVAMASSWFPHNLKEVIEAAVYLESNPDCSTKDLLDFIKGPDFPSGGTIINKNKLSSIYECGRGSVRVRGEYEIDKNKIIFTSIPYKVSKDTLILAIDKLCEEKKISGINGIRDESKKDVVRFVIELDKKTNPTSVISKLFQMTHLESSYSFNQVALVDKVPKLLNLKQYLSHYLDHQKDVLTRKTNFDIKKIEDRLHILEGIAKALEDIDNIISLIKGSHSAAAAREALIAKYSFSVVQTKAILDMKLSKLANLEQIEIQNEIANLLQEKNKNYAILENISKELIRILTEFKNKFADERRTKISQLEETKEDKEVELVQPEKMMVILTENNSIKRIPKDSFKTQRRGGKGIKVQNDATKEIISTDTIDNLLIFSSFGKVYKLLVDNIPLGTNSSKGESLYSLIPFEAGEIPLSVTSLNRNPSESHLLFITKKGYIKKTKLEEFSKFRGGKGVKATVLRDGDKLVSVVPIEDENIIIITKNGLSLKIKNSDIPVYNKTARGVIGIKLKEEDSILTALSTKDETDFLAVVSKNGYSKKTLLNEFPLQGRAGVGVQCFKPVDENDSLAGALILNDNDSVLIAGNRSSICIEAKEISTSGRATIGSLLIKDNLIQSISKI